MEIVETIEALRSIITDWRRRGDSISLVPTMGNLHRGHIRLASEAAVCSDRVIASIFVNPTQFGENEDFGSYPRTLNDDADILRGEHTDLLFIPAIEEIYPSSHCTTVEVSYLQEQLCGEFRPGHFAGVATIVCKLLNMVQPNVAVFGEKDYQQLVIIRRMVEDLNILVEIRGIETVREADGLALSSRNAYLSQTDRALAPQIHRALCSVKKAIEQGDRGDLPFIPLHHSRSV